MGMAMRCHSWGAPGDPLESGADEVLFRRMLLATAITTAATLSAYIFTDSSAHRLPGTEWRERQRRRARTAIEDLLGATIQTVTAHQNETAAVVYFPDSAGVLRPRFSHNKRKPLHDLLTFE